MKWCYRHKINKVLISLELKDMEKKMEKKSLKDGKQATYGGT